jgi:hypothetical protein
MKLKLQFSIKDTFFYYSIIIVLGVYRDTH